jgi:hypothetical protein
MTNCAETARTPDVRQLVDVAAILAAGILRLRERDSLPECAHCRPWWLTRRESDSLKPTWRKTCY